MKIFITFITFITSFFVLITANTAISMTEKELTDYFNNIPNEYFSPAKNSDETPFRHKIFEENGKYFFLSFDKITKISPLIDSINGYLHIDDIGKEAGCASNCFFGNEMAIFTSKSKTTYVALKNIISGSFIGVEELYIFKIENNKYIDVTNKILPKVSWSQFVSNNKNNQLIANEFEELYKSDMNFTLPRYGTTIVISQKIENLSALRSFSEGDDMIKYQKMRKIIKYRNLYFKWNENKEIFELNKKE